jgi:hypothetical protein
LNVLSPAVNNLYKRLQATEYKRIGVTVPQNFDFMATSWPPSAGKILDTAKQPYKQPIKDICSVMQQSGAPFMVNIYPFLTRRGNTKDIPLDYALFKNKTRQFTDPGTRLDYYNLFDSMLDALHFALKDIGYENLEIVVGESGWPTAEPPKKPDEETEATPANAQTFLTNLIAHCNSGKGTPMRPGKPIQCFAFEMFDEDKKNTDPGTFEHYWGVYDGLGKPKFPSIVW